jgi:hypothetical protein
MEEFIRPIKRIDYTHFIIYDGVEYIRTETLFLKCYRWEGESEPRDLHTIKWELRDERESPLVEYFSLDSGWSKNGKLKKSNPIPKLEKIFKETIGKDLLYFEYSKQIND